MEDAKEVGERKEGGKKKKEATAKENRDMEYRDVNSRKGEVVGKGRKGKGKKKRWGEIEREYKHEERVKVKKGVREEGGEKWR